MEDDAYEADAEILEKEPTGQRAKKPRVTSTSVATYAAYAPSTEQVDPMAGCVTFKDREQRIAELKARFQLHAICDRIIKQIYWISYDPNDKEVFWFRLAL